MARLYLISPPYQDVYKKINYKNFGVLQPPLGLAYIASYVKRHGHSVMLFDGSFSRDIFKDIKANIAAFNPDFVGITATTPQIASALKIAEYIKNLAPDIKIILGGFHVSALPEQTLTHRYVDIVVCGEGEITISEIIGGKDICDIKGIYFRQMDSIRKNAPRPLIEDLDSLPFPLWEGLPVRSYYYFPEHTVGIISGRGCPYGCSFCASAVIHGNRYRMRSPNNFVDEIELLRKDYGVEYLFFVDETFTINPQRTEEICSIIQKRKISVKWTCDTRVDHVTKDMLRIMKSAGCRSLRIGVESADERVLKMTGKNITLAEAERAISWANELGIKTTAYFILGLPYETPASLDKTLVFSKKLNTDVAQFSMLVPLPGTKIWDIVQEGKILRCTAKEWDEYVRYDKAIVESDLLSASQLLAYQRHIVKSYYLSPLYILKRLGGIRSFRELWEVLRGGMAVLIMIFSKKNVLRKNSSWQERCQ
ncbi:MAG: radical SAM protein [Candidatus Omnitrophota bacterium]